MSEQKIVSFRRHFLSIGVHVFVLRRRVRRWGFARNDMSQSADCDVADIASYRTHFTCRVLPASLERLAPGFERLSYIYVDFSDKMSPVGRILITLEQNEYVTTI